MCTGRNIETSRKISGWREGNRFAGRRMREQAAGGTRRVFAEQAHFSPPCTLFRVLHMRPGTCTSRSFMMIQVSNLSRTLRLVNGQRKQISHFFRRVAHGLPEPTEVQKVSLVQNEYLCVRVKVTCDASLVFPSRYTLLEKS